MKKFLIALFGLMIAASCLGLTLSGGGGGDSFPPQSGATNGQFVKSTGVLGDEEWATIGGGGDMLGANNLSDVVDPATSATNIELGTGDSVVFVGVSANGSVSANAFFGSGEFLTNLFTTTNANLLYVTPNYNFGVSVNGVVSANELNAITIVAVSLNIPAKSVSLDRLARDSATDGQAVVWSDSNDRYEPGTVGGGGSTPTQNMMMQVVGEFAAVAQTNIFSAYTLVPTFSVQFPTAGTITRIAVYGELDSSGTQPDVTFNVSGGAVATLNLANADTANGAVPDQFISTVITQNAYWSVDLKNSGGNNDFTDGWFLIEWKPD